MLLPVLVSKLWQIKEDFAGVVFYRFYKPLEPISVILVFDLMFKAICTFLVQMILKIFLVYFLFFLSFTSPPLKTLLQLS